MSYYGKYEKSVSMSYRKLFLWVVLLCKCMPLSADITAEKGFLNSARDSDVLLRKEEILDAIYLNAVDDETQLSAERLEMIEENLTECISNKIDLNNEADLDRLDMLPFISAQQADNIRIYVHSHGPLRSFYELMLVDGLFRQDILNLLPFVRLDFENEKQRKVRFEKMLQVADHELILRTDRTLEKKRGYRSDTPKGYLGNEQYGSIRYRLRYENRLFINLGAEKDPGEPFWTDVHKGFDAYRYSFQVNGSARSVLNRLVAGHFRTSFGMGLAMNSDFYMSKDPSCNRIVSLGTGLRRYTSAEGNDFFHGGGVTLRLSNRWFITGLYSNRTEDAVLRDGGTTFASLTTDGLHRTETERKKMDNVRQQVAAGRAEWRGNRIRIGGVLLWQHYNPFWKPLPQPYNIHRFSGKDLSIASVDYRIHWRRATLMGETAINRDGSTATLNNVNVSLLRWIRLSLLYRNYSRSFDNPLASAYGQSSSVRNEEGLYTGISFQLRKHWQLSAFIDVYRFPEQKYGVSQPSDGWETMVRLDHEPNDRIKWSLRYRMKNTEKDLSKNRMPEGTEGKILTDYKRSSLRGRMSLILTPDRSLTLMGQAEGSRADYSRDCQDPTFGWMGNASLICRPKRFPIRTAVGVTRFDAEDYENRLYQYESDVLYGYSMPMFYGKGWRYGLNASVDVGRHISLYLFFARMSYDDGRSSISSGLEEIRGHHKTDLHLLLRLKL